MGQIHTQLEREGMCSPFERILLPAFSSHGMKSNFRRLFDGKDYIRRTLTKKVFAGTAAPL
jgi:hypothetical protein